MKLCVFAYNFSHKKTFEVLTTLHFKGVKINHIFAANKLKLNIRYSKERVSIKNIKYIHPKIIAQKIKSKYTVIKHDSKNLVKVLKKEKFDLGIVAGARILKKQVVECFKIGVLNLHPGILPLNRGLDTHKWAILNNWPQGVTAHLIDAKIDAGKIICKKKIVVYPDDTLVDINYRLQNTELELMIKSINILKKKKFFKDMKNTLKNLHSCIDNKNEKKMRQVFKNYKKNYFKII